MPDGVWFGYVVDAHEGGIQFDLACWFSGQAVVEAAAEDGAESPPPNDYYVRNQNPDRRDFSLGDDLMVTWYRSGDPQKKEYTHYAAWLAERAVDDTDTLPYPFGIWITVDRGEVTELSEQYVP